MRSSLIAVALLVIGPAILPATAGIPSRAIQESAEWVSRKFVKGAVRESVESLSGKMGKLAVHYGDEVVTSAFRKIGPRTSHLVAEAGEHGGVALKLLSRHGDAAVNLVTRSGTLSKIAQYGDDAAEAFIKHGSVGERLVESFGKEAIQGLAKVTPQNGRRLSMMAADGLLKPELLSVISRSGDTAAEFIWKHKGSLAVGAVLTAFVSDPEPFLKGTKEIATLTAESAIKPLTSIPNTVALEAAKGMNWNAVVMFAFACVAAVTGSRLGWFMSVRQSAQRIRSSMTKSSKEGI